MRTAMRVILALTFTVLFVAMVALTVRNFWRSDMVAYIAPDSGNDTTSWHISLLSGGGTLGCGFVRFSRSDKTFGRRPGQFVYEAGPALQQWSLGVRVYTEHAPGSAFTVSQYRVMIPFWLSLLATGIPAGYFLFQLRRHWPRRLSPTTCRSCGYDLRAGHEKCPECGAVSHVKAAGFVNATAS